MVVFFQMNNAVPPQENIPISFLDALRGSLQHFRDQHQMRLPLIDSSFHRLLVHVVCEYHGLKSESVNSCGRGSGCDLNGKTKMKKKTRGVKDVIITLRNSNKLFGHGISIRSHVLDSKLMTQQLNDYDADYVIIWMLPTSDSRYDPNDWNDPLSSGKHQNY